jgi:hypothetical protein
MLRSLRRGGQRFDCKARLAECDSKVIIEKWDRLVGDSK